MAALRKRIIGGINCVLQKASRTISNPCRKSSIAGIRTRRIFPSLIIIDGGKGQLSSALEVIRGVGLGDVRVIGLAKGKRKFLRKGPMKASFLINPQRLCISSSISVMRPIALPLPIIGKGFAKRNLVSVLDHIEGIGPKRRAALWQRFASFEKMREASVEDLEAVPTMTRTAAEKLFAFLHASASDKRTFIK